MTPTLELLNDDHWLHGRLYLLELDDVSEMPEQLALPESHHACLVLWDSSSESVEVISGVIDVLRAAGCVSFCAWGEGCGRVELFMDEAEVMARLDLPDDGSVVMTSSHDEPLDDALFFYLYLSGPDTVHSAFPRVGLVLSIGMPDNVRQRVRDAMMTPDLVC